MSDEQESVIILRASDTGRDLKSEVSAVFVDGFYQWLSYFSKAPDSKRNGVNDFVYMKVLKEAE